MLPPSDDSTKTWIICVVDSARRVLSEKVITWAPTSSKATLAPRAGKAALVIKREMPPEMNPAALGERNWRASGFDGVAALAILALDGGDGRPIFLPTVPERNPRSECGYQPVAFISSLAVTPPGRFSSSRILAVLLPSRASGLAALAFSALGRFLGRGGILLCYAQHFSPAGPISRIERVAVRLYTPKPAGGAAASPADSSPLVTVSGGLMATISTLI